MFLKNITKDLCNEYFRILKKKFEKKVEDRKTSMLMNL